MRIVSWNCNGALRNKTDPVDLLLADILIVQECEDPGESLSSYQQWAGNYIWQGFNKNKGIGVFARTGTEIKALNWSKRSFKGALPNGIIMVMPTLPNLAPENH